MEIRYTKHYITDANGTQKRYKRIYVYKDLSATEIKNINIEESCVQLEPCPFCGFSGFLNCGNRGYFGWCPICGTEGPTADRWYDAANMWNDRSLNTVNSIKHLTLTHADVNFFDDKNIEEAVKIKERHYNG